MSCNLFMCHLKAGTGHTYFKAWLTETVYSPQMTKICFQSTQVLQKSLVVYCIGVSSNKKLLGAFFVVDFSLFTKVGSLAKEFHLNNFTILNSIPGSEHSLRHGEDHRRLSRSSSSSGTAPFRHKPFFDTQIHQETGLGARNVTTVEGGKATLVCTVKNLGANRTVSSLWLIQV